MMIKISYIFTLLLPLFLLAGCAREDFMREKEPDKGLILKYRIDQLNHSEEEEKAAGENHINSLYVMFFDYSMNGGGKLAHICHISPDSTSSKNPAGNIYLDLSGQEELLSEDYNLLVTANVEYYVRANQFTGTAEEIEKLVQYFASLWKEKTEAEVARTALLRLDSGAIIPNHLPMSGRVIKKAGVNEAEVRLSRCVSRIDLINEDPGYELVSASLWNVVPRTNVWDNSFVDYTAEKHLHEFNKYYTDNLSDNKIIGHFYTFENHVAHPGQNDTTSTCLIVGLKRQKEKAYTEYYRINLNPTMEPQALRRNHLYKVTIKRVLGDGKGSERDAYENSQMVLAGSVKSWQEDDFSTLQFDGENVLHLSLSKILFSPSGGNEEIKILARGNSEVKISQKILSPGIEAVLNSGKDKLLVSATHTFDEREGLVEVEYGNLKANVQIIQSGEHTEWIELWPATLPVFPADKDNAGPGEEIKVAATDTWIARIYNESNENRFSFASNDTITELKTNGKDTFRVYLMKDNEQTTPQYSFITVFLEENPLVSRVLLLTQEGTKGD